MNALVSPAPRLTADRTLVVIPTYNERDNLPRIVPELLAVDAGLDILVVDDASPDGTGNVAEQLAQADSRIRVLHRPGKLGRGSAYLAGFADALARGYARVVEMDAEFSHCPADLPRLVQATSGSAAAHMAIGARLVSGGQTLGWSALRHTVSQGGSLLARLVLGLTVRAGLRLVAVPITFRDRQYGRSRMSWLSVAEAIWVLVSLRFAPTPRAQRGVEVATHVDAGQLA